jgi:hypothetical protein
LFAMSPPRRTLIHLAAVLLVMLADMERRKAANRPRFHMRALVSRMHSPWAKVYRSKCDLAFMHTMGLDVAAFHKLMPEFNRLYCKFTLAGKKITSKHASLSQRVLDSASVLGLLLHWLATKAEEKYLCLIFGCVDGTLNRYKNFGIGILMKVLRIRKDCRVDFPNKHEQQELAKLVQKKEPLVEGVWGFLDGLNLQSRSPGDIDAQNAMYNGWLHGTHASCIFVWRADGLLAHATLNAPGSWHDALLGSLGLYSSLDRRCHGVSAIACDSAFPKPTRCPHIVRVGKEEDRPEDENELLVYEALQNALISVRQAAEWGMGTFQASFKRLTTRLSETPHKRLKLLKLCTLLMNYRTINVGQNQIRTVFGNLGNLEDAGLDNIYGVEPKMGFFGGSDDEDDGECDE